MAALSLRRGNIDDTAPGRHVRHNSIDHVERAVYIGLVDLVEVLRIEVAEYIDQAPGTSVVDCFTGQKLRTQSMFLSRTEYINVISLKTIKGGLYDLFRAFGAVNAGLDDEGLTTRFTKSGGNNLGTLSCRVRDVIDDNACAVASEGECDACANAILATRASDYGNFALKGKGICGHCEERFVDSKWPQITSTANC